MWLAARMSAMARGVGLAAVSGTLLAGMSVFAASAPAQQRIVKLTQVGCQFLESENGVNRGFRPNRKADCEEINARTGAQRLAEAKVLELPAGDYIFRVENRDVPYTLGFFLREKDYDWRNPLHRLTKTSVSGGGLEPGTTRDYRVSLKPGEYLYSCPLNTTPDYRLIVTN